MQEKPLLPPKDAPGKRVWKTWKGICLAAYASALLFGQWLPGIVVAICYLAGIIATGNLILHLLRYLRNRIFWRVRYRIIGSFIFVGLIPLLLVLGIIFLSAYMLMGQLSTHYVESSLHDLAREVTKINLDLGRKVMHGASRFCIA